MPNIQLYIHHKNDELNIILVDIFYLGIPGRKNGIYIQENKFLKNRKNKINIKDIIKP